MRTHPSVKHSHKRHEVIDLIRSIKELCHVGAPDINLEFKQSSKQYIQKAIIGLGGELTYIDEYVSPPSSIVGQICLKQLTDEYGPPRYVNFGNPNTIMDRLAEKFGIKCATCGIIHKSRDYANWFVNSFFAKSYDSFGSLDSICGQCNFLIEQEVKRRSRTSVINNDDWKMLCAEFLSRSLMLKARGTPYRITKSQERHLSNLKMIRSGGRKAFQKHKRIDKFGLKMSRYDY